MGGCHDVIHLSRYLGDFYHLEYYTLATSESVILVGFATSIVWSWRRVLLYVVPMILKERACSTRKKSSLVLGGQRCSYPSSGVRTTKAQR